MIKVLIESYFPSYLGKWGRSGGAWFSRGSLLYILATGRALLGAWALAWGNAVIGHSVRLEDAVNPIVAVMKSWFTRYFLFF